MSDEKPTRIPDDERNELVRKFEALVDKELAEIAADLRVDVEAILSTGTGPEPAKGGLASLVAEQTAGRGPSVILAAPAFVDAYRKALHGRGAAILTRAQLDIIEARATGRICALLGV